MLLKKQTKKMIAPVVITVLVISYFIFYMWLGFAESGGHSFADENTVDRCPQRIDCADGVLVNRKSE